MGEHETIFLADDSSDYRKSTKFLLETFGHKIVAEAVSVPTAISVIDNPNISFRVGLIDGFSGNGEKVFNHIKARRPEVTAMSLSAKLQTWGDIKLSKVKGPLPILDAIQNVK